MTFDREKCIAILQKINSIFQSVEKMIDSYGKLVIQNVDGPDVAELRKTIVMTLEKLKQTEVSVKKDDLEGKMIPLIRFQDEEIKLLDMIAYVLDKLHETPELRRNMAVITKQFDALLIEEIKTLTRKAA